MKFGFPVWYSDKPFKTAIEKVHRLGFDYIEFDLNPPSIERLTKDELKLLEKIGDEYDLEIAFHGPWSAIDICNLNDKISESSLSVILDTIKFSEQFNPLYFNFHLMSYSNPYVLGIDNIKNEIYEKALDNLKKIIRSTKIILTLENNGTNPIFRTLEEFNNIKNNIKSYNMNFCFDVGHAAKNKFRSNVPWELKDWLNSFKNKIIVTHLHDCLIKGNEAIDHIPIGSGNINFNEIFASIKNTKCKYALIEIARVLEGSLTENQIKQNLDFCKNNL